MEKGKYIGSMHAMKKQAEAVSMREKSMVKLSFIIVPSGVGSPKTMYVWKLEKGKNILFSNLVGPFPSLPSRILQRPKMLAGLNLKSTTNRLQALGLVSVGV